MSDDHRRWRQPLALRKLSSRRTSYLQPIPGDGGRASKAPCPDTPQSGPTRAIAEFCNTISSIADIRHCVEHVCFVPCVDGSWLASQNFTSRRWSVQPCVRPVSAVRMTAGHNALRGSGPGQKPAFDNALAHVGCPDRRIDRLYITCCSPSQPSHHAGCPA